MFCNTVALIIAPSLVLAYRPMYLEDQNGQSLLYKKGNPYLVSSKRHVVYLEPLQTTLKRRRAKFLITMVNNSRQVLNLHPDMVRVFDQQGREIFIKTKNEVLQKHKNREFWAALFQGFAASSENREAQEAGRTHYHQTERNYLSGEVRQVNGYSETPYAQHRALEELSEKHRLQREAIKERSRYVQGKIENIYLDHHSLLSNDSHQALFQFTVPRKIERHLRWLDIEITLDGEVHRFRVNCGKSRGWWS